ncbi:hypothetical protein Pmar_PMAR011949 [Perkinsus marinus ATCC 50983]|uniref:Uncharacterized protein n=1 Tax=Perkinsus marinus (strain ATCC 50983 / TXsc) TaxID=423536 RepID=C5LBS2_PERM5|nr:hypothetical protein Pmar_PMAR011949 [Perkinsus marinus ATCC 50983]EER05893.1 hypothetical protein Pmar_PMAR011949 [Perkinsus marinus ATCC 50983]|eukprot:XP_002774077.1 hypothetical protein Pmar_PMAR011949 [Perkinsus marinus ATCC 50983]
MWHVVRRGRANDRTTNATTATRRHLKTSIPKPERARKLWCEMDSSSEEGSDRSVMEDDDVWAMQTDALSSRSDVEDVIPNEEVCKVDDTISRRDITDETRSPCAVDSWEEPQDGDKARPHAASLSSGSTSTAEPSPVPAPCYPPPGIHHDSLQWNAPVAAMERTIPVFHPNGPFPECVVQGGVCSIPWHPKGPHVHVMHILFNAPNSDTEGILEEADMDLEKGRPITEENAKEIFDEDLGLAYDINPKRKRVAKLWVDEEGNTLSRIWEKKLNKPGYFGTMRETLSLPQVSEIGKKP